MATPLPLPLLDYDFTPEEHDTTRYLILLNLSFGLPFTWGIRRKRTALLSPPLDNAARVDVKRSKNKPSMGKKSQHLEAIDRLNKKIQELNRMILRYKDEGTSSPAMKGECSNDKHHSEFQPSMEDQTAPVAGQSNNNRVGPIFPLCEPSSSSYGPTEIPDLNLSHKEVVSQMRYRYVAAQPTQNTKLQNPPPSPNP